MLSISAPMKGLKRLDYYLSLQKDDYYTSDTEDEGTWFGKAASKLGLGKTVDPDEFRMLLCGFSPDGSKALVQNAADPDRQNAWDGTFSAPKSVSLAWAFGSRPLKFAIEAAHRDAVNDALTYIEEHTLTTRRGKGGAKFEKANALFASFPHRTSRELDPQLHTHCVLINLAVRADGSTGSLWSRDFFRAKMYAGAVYQASLGKRLQELGFEVNGDQGFAALQGIPGSVCKAFSTRRAKIEDELQRTGQRDAAAAKTATLKTRPEKITVSVTELHNKWNKQASRMGWSFDESSLHSRVHREQPSCGAKELFEVFAQKLQELPQKQRNPAASRRLAVKAVFEMNPNANAIDALFARLNREHWANEPIHLAYSKKQAPRPSEQRASKATDEAPSGSSSIERGHAQKVRAFTGARAEDHGGTGSAMDLGDSPRSKDKESSALGATGRRDSGAEPPESYEQPSESTDRAPLFSGAKSEVTGRGATSKSDQGESYRQQSSALESWTTAELASLDPRNAIAPKDQLDLYFRCLEAVSSFAIYTRKIPEFTRSAEQVRSNKAFRNQLKARIESIRPEDQTISVLTWQTVRSAVQAQADPQSLLKELVTPQRTNIGARRKWWSEEALSLFDPRNVETRSDVRNLYDRWLQAFRARSILGEPRQERMLPLSDRQKNRNAAFKRSFADQLAKIPEPYRTARNITWAAVHAAIENRADSRTLLAELNAHSKMAHRPVRVEGVRLFPNSPFQSVRSVEIPKLVLQMPKSWAEVIDEDFAPRYGPKKYPRILGLKPQEKFSSSEEQTNDSNQESEGHSY